MNLKDYLFKNVQIIDDEGKEWTGKVIGYESAYDNDDTEDSITINTPQFLKGPVEFNKSEIKSIKAID